MQDRLHRTPGEIYLRVVQPFSYSFDCKRPEHFINHVEPHTSAVNQECVSSYCEDFVLILYYSVLVVRAYATGYDLLIFHINSVDETIFSKPAVVGVVVLNISSSLFHYFLYC